MPAVRDYPWQALESISRRYVQLAGNARQALGGSDAPRIAAALGELVGGEVEVVVRDFGRARVPAGAREIVLRVGDRAHYGVALEPDGVQALLSRALGRPLGITRQELELGSALSGAGAAMAVAVARQLTREPVHLASAPSGDPLELEASLIVDGQAFAAGLRAWIEPSAPRPVPTRDRFALLEVDVPLVVALSLARRSELETLSVGDAWLPGDGWWIDRSLQGRGALAAPAGELGVWVDLAPGGRVVLRGGSAALAADAELSPQVAMEGPDPSPEGSLASVVADAPVVVRVELGSVSLNAAEAAALRPGDVIETGKRIGEPVVLRVAGRAIARGDLVEVEGELGVRIRELLGREP